MIREFLKKIRKWYQSHVPCLKTQETYATAWQYILEQAELANETWYVETKLASPARESFSQESNG